MLVCVGCQWHLKPAETDAAGKRIGIQRFDRIEMLYLTTGDYSALQQMNTYFPTETRMLIEDMLHLGHVDDPEINTKFLYFFQDSTLQQMLNTVIALDTDTATGGIRFRRLQLPLATKTDEHQ